MFDAARLEPARPCALTITNHAGKPLCDSWTLKTFPAPNDQPRRLRLLIYTCAGGHDALRTPQNKPVFLPMNIRGRLLERGLSFQPDALIAIVPPSVEAWMMARMNAPGIQHVVNIPSTPFGWSAGKWGEWYADILDDKGKLGIAKPKPYWQRGWRAQHDRLLTAASAMRGRIPLAISGDLHAIGETRIMKTQQTDLGANPVVSILSGPVSTGATGWPSAFRGVRPLPPSEMDVDERLPALEENGFILADFTPDKVRVSFFRWNASQPVAEIDALQPFREQEYKRP